MAEKDDADNPWEPLHDGWQPPKNLSDEAKARITAIQGELKALSILIRNLGDRLGAGETDVRKDLNPAIRRQSELSSELYELRKQAGFREPPQVMYGPPWQAK